jgi:hypothetical protein
MAGEEAVERLIERPLRTEPRPIERPRTARPSIEQLPKLARCTAQRLSRSAWRASLRRIVRLVQRRNKPAIRRSQKSL